MKVIIDDESRIIAYAQTGEIDGFIEVDVPDEFVDNFKPEYYKYDNGNVILNSSFKNTSTVVPEFKATNELIADLTQQIATMQIHQAETNTQLLQQIAQLQAEKGVTNG